MDGSRCTSVQGAATMPEQTCRENTIVRIAVPKWHTPNQDTRVEFAKRLRLAIDTRGIKINDLAEQSQVDRMSIYNYLLARRTPMLDNAARLCDVLNVSLDWALGRMKQ